MSALARIAQLHRELAEAYEQLEQEGTRPKPVKRTPPPSEPADPETVALVRRKLRRIGVSA